MINLPKSILEKLNFDNNKELIKSIKKLTKLFCCSEKDIYENLKHYNLYDYDINYFKIKRNSSDPQLSIENEKFEHLLYNNNIDYEVEFTLGGYYYDFKIQNILVEINPTWTHNSTYDVTINRKKINKLTSNYHYEKTKFAVEKGYLVVNVYEWNDPLKLIPILKGEKKIKMNFRGVRKHEVKLTSSSKYRSFILDKNNQILKEVSCYIFDDGYDIILI